MRTPALLTKMLTREERIQGTGHHPEKIEGKTARVRVGRMKRYTRRKKGKSDRQARLCMKVACSLDSGTHNLKCPTDRCSRLTNYPRYRAAVEVFSEFVPLQMTIKVRDIHYHSRPRAT